MKTETTTKYIAQDGEIFYKEEQCKEYEVKLNNWYQLLKSKIGDFQPSELAIGHGVTEVSSLPYEAPWLSPFGAGLIMITDIHRSDDGELEFQLGDENNKPYEKEDGSNYWVKANDFYDEWPD